MRNAESGSRTCPESEKVEKKESDLVKSAGKHGRKRDKFIVCIRSRKKCQLSTTKYRISPINKFKKKRLLLFCCDINVKLDGRKWTCLH